MQKENGRSRDVVVEIENQSCRQQFLGGWRKKTSGLCFYHAQTQTNYSFGPDDRLQTIETGNGGILAEKGGVFHITNDISQLVK